MRSIYLTAFAALLVLTFWPQAAPLTQPQLADPICGPNTAYKRLAGGIAQCYDKRGRKTKKVKLP